MGASQPHTPRSGTKRTAARGAGGRAGLAAALVGLAACQPSDRAPAPAKPVTRTRVARPFSSWAAMRLEREMDPAMLAIARRFDPERRRDLGGRTQGWAVLDLTTAPSLDLGVLSPEEAQRINALLPSLGEPPAPVAPFHLKATAGERDRALLCLSQAIYYEAALEPDAGQRAVAQAILNRVRHPAFPKSVCGVVYQGSAQVTGCQFSFTCDGSRARTPIAPFWQRAQAVAQAALNGFVMRAVGTATAYHADYVFPRWGPTFVKIGQIGAHIFYRFPGPAGQAASFRQAYRGGETRVSMAGPSPEALAAAKAAGAIPGAATDTVSVIDPTAPGGVRSRAAGQIVFGRRVPTHDEIARINAALAGMDPPAKPPASAPAKEPAFSDKLPIGKP